MSKPHSRRLVALAVSMLGIALLSSPSSGYWCDGHAGVYLCDPDCNPMYDGTAIITSAGVTYTYVGNGRNFGLHHIHLLGSTSGLAHDNGNGVQIGLRMSNGQYIDSFYSTNYGPIGGLPEVWLTMGTDGSGSALSNGTGELVCFDPDVLSSLDLPYLQQVVNGGPVTIHPSFGGSGAMQVQIKMCDGQYGPVGIFFDGRSTDANADGDTDEADENIVRAAITSQDTLRDLNWSGTVDTADVNIVLLEARRRVTAGVCYLDSYVGGGDPTPNAYNPNSPSNRNAQYAPATITNLSVTRIDANTVRLSWTAPADDGSSGYAATAYAVRRSGSAITTVAEFNAATVVSSPPTPGTPGGTQTMDVTLAAGTSAYFAIRTMDDVDNWSAVSNSPQIQNTAPADITTLGASPGRYMVKLNWTAPGEDGSFGTATGYDVRYRQGSTISEANWSTSTQASGEPSPAVAGTTECFLVDQLSGCTSYSFAVKSQDASGQWSAISNVKTVTTKCSGTLSFDCGGASAHPSWDEDADRVTVLALAGMSPNPARTAGSLTYSIPAEDAGEPLELGVFDVTGRRMVTLATGEAIVGTHRVAWALTSSAGERVRPGVYFVRLRVGGKTLSRSVQVSP